MDKLITFTQEQVQQIKGLLNGVTTTGVQNARQVAMIAQILDSGVPAETKKEGEA